MSALSTKQFGQGSQTEAKTSIAATKRIPIEYVTRRVNPDDHYELGTNPDGTVRYGPRPQ